MIRALAIFATLLLLWALVGQVNHYLAPLQVYLFLGGLAVTFAALRLPPREALLVVVLAGLLADASTPLAFGTHLLLFATAGLAIQNARDRIPQGEIFAQVLVALLANVALFTALSLIRGGPANVATWTRLAVDLLCSQGVIVAIGPWFFALQAHALQLARPRFSPFD